MPKVNSFFKKNLKNIKKEIKLFIAYYFSALNKHVKKGRVYHEEKIYMGYCYDALFIWVFG